MAKTPSLASRINLTGSKSKKPVKKPENSGKALKKIVENIQKNAPVKPKPKQANSAAVSVSNLPKDISVSSVREFFHSKIGPVVSCSFTYNDRGDFTGESSIVFRRGSDAELAVRDFNGVTLDGGKFKLKVRLVSSGNNSLADRIDTGSSAGSRVPDASAVDSTSAKAKQVKNAKKARQVKPTSMRIEKKPSVTASKGSKDALKSRISLPLAKRLHFPTQR